MNTWKDDDEIIKYIRKYYEWTAGRSIKCKEDHGSLRPTLAVVKKNSYRPPYLKTANAFAGCLKFNLL